MKKRIVMLLCTAVLALGLTLAPAMASGGPFYPIKVDEYTYTMRLESLTVEDTEGEMYYEQGIPALPVRRSLRHPHRGF